MKKIMIIISTLILASMAGLYFVSTKINEKEILNKVNNYILEKYPNAIVQIGEMNYSLGFNVLFDISSIEISQKDNNQKLINVKDVQVFVPIWNILKKSGKIRVELKKPSLFFVSYPNESNNINETFRENKVTIDNEKKKPKVSDETSNSEYLNKIVIDLSIIDAYLDYKDKKDHYKSVVDKLIINNIGTDKNIAYECLSSVEFLSGNKKTFSSKVKLIGEVDLKKFSEKLLTTNFHLEALDTFLSQDFKDVDLKTHGKLVYDKEALSGHIKIKVVDLLTSEMDIKDANEVFSATNITLNASINNFLKKMNMHDIESSLNNKDTSIDLSGGFSFSKEMQGNLKWKLNKPVEYSTELGNTFSTFEGSLIGDNIISDINTEIIGGKVTTSLKVNKINKVINDNELPHFKIDVLATNLKLTHDYIQKKMYSNKVVNNKKRQESKKETKTNTGQYVHSQLDLPKVTFSFILKDSQLAEQKMKIMANAKINKSVVNISQFDVFLSEGKSLLNGTFTSNKTVDDFKFTNTLTNIDFSYFKAFLPKALGRVEGVFSGQNSGAVYLNNEVRYDVNSNVTALNGSIEELDLGSYLKDFFNNELIRSKIDEKDIEFNSHFKSFSLNAKFNDKKIDINKMSFEGKPTSVDFNANGFVGMVSGRPSEIFLNLSDHKNKIKKAFNTDFLPIKLLGENFILKPKLNYTTKMLTNNLIKNEKLKVKKKVDEKVKKETDKLKAKAKDKAKELLKGLFK